MSGEELGTKLLGAVKEMKAGQSARITTVPDVTACADQEAIGGRIQTERQRLKFTQQQLANHLNISKKAQASYEAGRLTPSVNYLASIAALGVDAGYVVTGRRNESKAAAHNERASFMVHLRVSIGTRLRIERQRVGLTQEQVATLLNVAAKKVTRWEDSIPMPADQLTMLYREGFDVLFILTGKRICEINEGREPANEKLVGMYNRLPDKKRQLVLELLETLNSSNTGDA